MILVGGGCYNVQGLTRSTWSKWRIIPVEAPALQRVSSAWSSTGGALHKDAIMMFPVVSQGICSEYDAGVRYCKIGSRGGGGGEEEEGAWNKI